MENKKPRRNPYQALIDAYEEELLTIDVATCPNVHSQIKMEIRKLRDGIIDTIDLLSNKKIKLRTKIDFPVEQYPTVNFPGKVIGPAGKTLKDLQDLTDTRMSVLGAGSMRNQNKEIELVNSGEPKYQHLNERMHLQVDCLAEPFEAYEKLSKALVEIKKIITPDPEEVKPPPTPFSWTEIGFQQQSMGGRGRGMPSFNHAFPTPNFEMGRRGGRGRGGYRGGPPMHFNGGPPFGGGYEQNDVMLKMMPPQRFPSSQPYAKAGDFSEYQ